MKRYTVLAALAALTLFGCTLQAWAQSVPNIRGMQPFSAQAMYMSLTGNIRWQSFKENNVWISQGEAEGLVKAQIGAPQVGANE